MSGLDFDGDYGRQYRQRIRLSIPAYDAVLELGAAALAAKTPTARQVLVVGPGAAEELPGLRQAMPMARFALLTDWLGGTLEDDDDFTRRIARCFCVGDVVCLDPAAAKGRKGRRAPWTTRTATRRTSTPCWRPCAPRT